MSQTCGCGRTPIFGQDHHWKANPNQNRNHTALSTCSIIDIQQQSRLDSQSVVTPAGTHYSTRYSWTPSLLLLCITQERLLSLRLVLLLVLHVLGDVPEAQASHYNPCQHCANLQHNGDQEGHVVAVYLVLLACVVHGHQSLAAEGPRGFETDAVRYNGVAKACHLCNAEQQHLSGVSECNNYLIWQLPVWWASGGVELFRRRRRALRLQCLPLPLRCALRYVSQSTHTASSSDRCLITCQLRGTTKLGNDRYLP